MAGWQKSKLPVLEEIEASRTGGSTVNINSSTIVVRSENDKCLCPRLLAETIGHRDGHPVCGSGAGGLCD